MFQGRADGAGRHGREDEIDGDGRLGLEMAGSVQQEPEARTDDGTKG